MSQCGGRFVAAVEPARPLPGEEQASVSDARVHRLGGGAPAVGARPDWRIVVLDAQRVGMRSGRNREFVIELAHVDQRRDWGPTGLCASAARPRAICARWREHGIAAMARRRAAPRRRGRSHPSAGYLSLGSRARRAHERRDGAASPRSSQHILWWRRAHAPAPPCSRGAGAGWRARCRQRSARGLAGAGRERRRPFRDRDRSGRVDASRVCWHNGYKPASVRWRADPALMTFDKTDPEPVSPSGGARGRVRMGAGVEARWPDARAARRAQRSDKT